MTNPREQGLRMREIRQARGLAQDELARTVGRERHTIIDYEKGARRPKPRLLHAIARALQVDPAALLDRPGARFE